MIEIDVINKLQYLLILIDSIALFSFILITIRQLIDIFIKMKNIDTIKTDDDLGYEEAWFIYSLCLLGVAYFNLTGDINIQTLGVNSDYTASAYINLISKRILLVIIGIIGIITYSGKGFRFLRLRNILKK